MEMKSLIGMFEDALLLSSDGENLIELYIMNGRDYGYRLDGADDIYAEENRILRSFRLTDIRCVTMKFGEVKNIDGLPSIIANDDFFADDDEVIVFGVWQ